MTSDEVYKLIENNGLTLHGDIEHFEALVRADEREKILDMCKEGLWDAEGIRHHLSKEQA